MLEEKILSEDIKIFKYGNVYRIYGKTFDVREELKELADKHNLVPFCPEVYGGLTTPRIPSERLGDKVINKEGRDVTENFVRGA